MTERALVPITDELPAQGDLIGEEVEVWIRYRGRDHRMAHGRVDSVTVSVQNDFREIYGGNAYREYELTSRQSVDLHFDLTVDRGRLIAEREGIA